MARSTHSLRLTTLILFFVVAPAATAKDMQFGFARVDITPATPLRLSGYRNRDEPYEGIDEHLYVRAAALQSGSEPIHLLVSVETIGFSAAFSKRVQERIQEKHDIARSRFVLSTTHCHSAPHLAEGFDNIFARALSEEEQANIQAYASLVSDRITQAVDEAIADLQPGRMFHAQGKVTFALNRRMIQAGKWADFGVRPDGPVDHSLPLLTITDKSGQNVRGLIFNYACQCTTVLGEYNRVNCDWSGLRI